MAVTASTMMRGAQLPHRGRSSPMWTIAFLVLIISCQILLLIPAFGPARVLIRTAAFANALLYLILLPGGSRPHPASGLVVASLFVVALGLLHPTTNSFLSGIASFFLYLAVASPIFWVPRMEIGVGDFQRMLLLMWFFGMLSAGFGVLQVYYPGQFQPPTSTVLSESALAGLNITLSSGQVVPRPMGLTDTPGGAALGGFESIVLGIGLSLELRGFKRLVPLAGVSLGFFVLYLCQVRSLFVLAVICVLVMATVLALQGKLVRALGLSAAVTTLGVVAFIMAVSVGGEQTTKRLASLTDDGGFGQAYQANRGFFVTETFTEHLPRFPLGAGLGRNGMVATYFSDRANTEAQPIWCEIQWTTWLIDGGVPLMVCYFLAIIVTIYFVFRVSTLRLGRHYEGLQTWGVVLLGYDVAILANTFSYSIFNSQGGQEFWLLNGAFFATVCATSEKRDAH